MYWIQKNWSQKKITINDHQSAWKITDDVKQLRWIMGLLMGLLAVSVWATLPGPDIMIQCPNSDQVVKKATLRSGNTMGGRVWSDGYAVYPMLPSFPEITRCDDGPFFWVSEAKEVGEMSVWGDDSKVPNEWKQAKRIRFLTEAEYLEAIDMGMGRTLAQELHLRLLAWWAANEPLRQNQEQSGNTGQKIPFLPGSKARKNLEQLVKLLSITNPNQRLMRAEALRQLGRFEDALTILHMPFPENLTKVADWMRSLVIERDYMVKELFKTR
jgi:hypothetical protein